ncbi:MAG: hypothetical protein P4L82_02290 [Ancalomicrobiaceae bacterium]|nr:hypothetical protein [Ancalomicrobiaceae bacterium]
MKISIGKGNSRKAKPRRRNGQKGADTGAYAAPDSIVSLARPIIRGKGFVVA